MRSLRRRLFLKTLLLFWLTPLIWTARGQVAAGKPRPASAVLFRAAPPGLSDPGPTPTATPEQTSKQIAAISQPVADPKEGTAWTLEGAFEQALSGNPDLRLALEAVRRETGVYLQLRAGLLPRLDVSGNYERRADSLTDRPDSERLLPADRQTPVATASFLGRIEIRQTFFDGLTAWNDAGRGRYSRDRRIWLARDMALRTVTKVEQAYDALLFYQAAGRLYDRTAAARARLLEITRQRNKAGDVPEYQVLRVQTELQSSQTDVAEASSQQTTAEETFRQTLFIPQSEKNNDRIRLTETLGPRKFDLPFEEAVRLARAKRSDIEAARSALAGARAAVRAAYGDFFPKIEGYANLQARSSYFTSDFNQRLQGWAVGVQGSWSLFDGFGATGRLQVAKSDQRTALVQANQLDYLLLSEMKSLYGTLERSRAAIASQKSAVDYGEKGYSQAERSYELGQASFEDVLGAEVAWRRANLGYLQAVYQNNTAIAQLEYSISNYDELVKQQVSLPKARFAPVLRAQPVSGGSGAATGAPGPETSGPK